MLVGMAVQTSSRQLQPHACVNLTPAWKCISGGCNLNHAIDGFIQKAGFRIEQLEKAYIPGPKPMTFLYEGIARPSLDRRACCSYSLHRGRVDRQACVKMRRDNSKS